MEDIRGDNKNEIIRLMRDPRYKLCLGFYPDMLATDNTFGYKERNLLPQLSWKVAELRIHPTGQTAGAHWRLSLRTADGKRTFFNNTVEYLKNGYGQVRIGPGRDENGPSTDGNHNVNDVSFTLELNSDQYTLRDFLAVILSPQGYEPDGVYQDQPMCWYHYTGYKVYGNRECRHWVQSAARAFWHAKLIKADPTALFRIKNDELGWKGKEIPKGTFFDHRPGTSDKDPAPLEVEGGLEGVEKGVLEQARLADGLPGWI